jgi:hypothetical protein
MKYLKGVIISENNTAEIAKAYAYKTWESFQVTVPVGGSSGIAIDAKLKDESIVLEFVTLNHRAFEISPDQKYIGPLSQILFEVCQFKMFVSNPITNEDDIDRFLSWFDNYASLKYLKDNPTAIIPSVPNDMSLEIQKTIYASFRAKLEAKKYAFDFYLSDSVIKQFNIDTVKISLDNALGHMLPGFDPESVTSHSIDLSRTTKTEASYSHTAANSTSFLDHTSSRLSPSRSLGTNESKVPS